MTTIQSIEIEGKRFVIIPADAYDRFREGEAGLPPLPPVDADGNSPAREYIRATLARNIIRDRRAVGLTQKQLAKLAGVREETINRLESGKHKPNVRTVEKIDRALKRTALRRRRVG